MFLNRELELVKASMEAYTEASLGVVCRIFNDGITGATVIKQQYKHFCRTDKGYCSYAVVKKGGTTFRYNESVPKIKYLREGFFCIKGTVFLKRM